MKCVGPQRCPWPDYRKEQSQFVLVCLVIGAMVTISLAAILVGKDGVITSAACGGMSAAVIAVHGRRVHGGRRGGPPSTNDSHKGGD